MYSQDFGTFAKGQFCILQAADSAAFALCNAQKHFSEMPIERMSTDSNQKEDENAEEMAREAKYVGGISEKSPCFPGTAAAAAKGSRGRSHRFVDAIGKGRGATRACSVGYPLLHLFYAFFFSAFGGCSGCASGILSINTEPSLGLLSTRIFPPWLAAIQCAMASPSPVPAISLLRDLSAR